MKRSCWFISCGAPFLFEDKSSGRGPTHKVLMMEACLTLYCVSTENKKHPRSSSNSGCNSASYLYPFAVPLYCTMSIKPPSHYLRSFSFSMSCTGRRGRAGTRNRWMASWAKHVLRRRTTMSRLMQGAVGLLVRRTRSKAGRVYSTAVTELETAVSVNTGEKPS